MIGREDLSLSTKVGAILAKQRKAKGLRPNIRVGDRPRARSLADYAEDSVDNHESLDNLCVGDDY